MVTDKPREGLDAMRVQKSMSMYLEGERREGSKDQVR